MSGKGAGKKMAGGQRCLRRAEMDRGTRVGCGKSDCCTCTPREGPTPDHSVEYAWSLRLGRRYRRLESDAREPNPNEVFHCPGCGGVAAWRSTTARAHSCLSDVARRFAVGICCKPWRSRPAFSALNGSF